MSLQAETQAKYGEIWIGHTTLLPISVIFPCYFNTYTDLNLVQHRIVQSISTSIVMTNHDN